MLQSRSLFTTSGRRPPYHFPAQVESTVQIRSTIITFSTLVNVPFLQTITFRMLSKHMLLASYYEEGVRWHLGTQPSDLSEDSSIFIRDVGMTGSATVKHLIPDSRTISATHSTVDKFIRFDYYATFSSEVSNTCK